ncbi:MAG TPA: acyl-CoA dehydrogenase family protein [Acidimicrobiales bacterium]|nr:acyl-CoA dehydrogenase family protein [Acidimicrobiales bacterium]
MDVRLSPEQHALQDAATKLALDLGPRTVRDLDDAERRAKLDAAVAAAGWRDLLADASVVEAALVTEVFGRHLVDVPLIETTDLTVGLALTSADLVGIMQGATDLAVNYARERRQYGQPVGAFQAVQHLLADAAVVTEGARSITLHAAWAADALDGADALAAAAAAKAYCARAARDVCETCIQVHGGIGNTWECLAHVYLRRALASIDAFGGVGPNLERVLAHGLR